jgi:hypothetical protein
VCASGCDVAVTASSSRIVLAPRVDCIVLVADHMTTTVDIDQDEHDHAPRDRPPGASTRRAGECVAREVLARDE